MSSIWKNRLSLSVFGQSHGAAIGVTLDGVPAGEEIDFNDLNKFLLRRAPGRFPWATPRKEADESEFISGIVNGKTCGAPITAVIKNTNMRSEDYISEKKIPRPGHADYTAHVKYGGNEDIRGGGHFSGRLTAALCIAGGICLQILKRKHIFIGAHIASVGNINDDLFDPVTLNGHELNKLNAMDLPLLNADLKKYITDEIENAKNENDSVGGVVECAAAGLPAGLGAPMFYGMENMIAQLVFAIPAVKGIEFGAGFSSAKMRGSENNDAFIIDKGKIQTSTNNHGGILGGITSGMPLIFRAAVKPTPSIAKAQLSVDLLTNEPATLKITGRHDPCIVPRAVPCFEAALAIAVCDALL